MNDVGKWIYLVTFERQYVYRGQTFKGRGTLRIPVLLDGRVIQGKKEEAQQRLVEAWAEIHRDELHQDWELLQSGRPPVKIEPLR